MILNNDLSVSNTQTNITTAAIENLKNSNVVGSIPFSVKVLTKIPLDPNIIPAKAGNKK